jgi:WD40 repeat protein
MTDSRSSGLSRVAAATAAVFVAGQRVGSAVLVSERRLLTAGHVLARAGADAASAVIEVEFPFAMGGGGARVPAQRLMLPAAAVDLGVLDLASGGESLKWLPPEVALWPARRLPSRVSVLGFPREEKALRGVWRDFDTVGPAADGTIQLDWAGEAGTLPGHSGGPVVDPVTGALAGVLVQGSQAGRFDRFLPMTVIGRCCPGLPFPWLMAGADARGHFTRRSRGQRSHARGGDLFRGRAAALAVVGGWLTAPRDQGRPLVVTGQPGAGKSAVLARAALDLEASRRGPGLAFHARSATHDDLLSAVADLTGAEHLETRDELLEALENQPLAEPVMIAVDALDEAASGPDRREIAGTLAELAAVPRVRVVVATRPLTTGYRYHADGLLPALGVSSVDSPALVDLDGDVYFDSAGLRQFAAAVLTQHQARHPGPVGAAWTAYRADPALCDRIGEVIAARAGRNYLVAAMAAVPLSVAEQAADPTAGFDLARIPSRVGEALAKYLEQLAEPQQSRTRALLTALAYARGDGVDDRTWLAFASALGYPVVMADLDQLRASSAADYLLQAIPNDSGPVTRLFHQALADELLDRRHQPSDERLLLPSLRPAPGASWATASAYALTYAADHASSARQLPTLLEDPSYLVYGNIARLPAVLSRDQDTAANPSTVLVRQVAARTGPLPPPRRARLLALTAAHFGLPGLRRRLAAECTQSFTPLWAHSPGIPHVEFIGHTGEVHGVATGRVGDRDVIVSGSADRTVRIWDAVTAQPIGNPLVGHTDSVEAVAVGRVGDRDVIVSGSADRTVRIWDAVTAHPIGKPLTGHTEVVTAVATGRPGQRDVIVSGSHDDTLRVWDAVTGELIGEPRDGPGAVEAVAIGRVGDRDMIVSAGSERTVWVWDAVTGELIGEPLAGHADTVTAVATGRVGDRDVVVSAGRDGTVRVRDAVTGQAVGKLLVGHTDTVEAVAVGPLGDRDVIVSAGADRTVRVWDAGTGQPVGAPLTGHTDIVATVVLGRVGDHDVIISAGWDGTVRVWDAVADRISGGSVTGHTDAVTAVAFGRVDGRDVVVSASWDGTVRLWDAVTGQPVGEPLLHTDAVYAMAVGRAGERDLIVSAREDGTVQMWDAVSAQPVGEPLLHTSIVYAVAVGQAGERDVIISASDDRVVRVWDAATAQLVCEPLVGHTQTVLAVAVGRAGDRDLIVSASYDDTVRLWDAVTGQAVGEPLVGHTGAVFAVAVGRVGDRDVVVSGGVDRVVRVWDAVTGQPVGESLVGHTGMVHEVAVGRVGGRDVIVSASEDGTVRIWDLTKGASVVIDLLGPATAAALTKDGGSLCIGAGNTICLFNA